MAQKVTLKNGEVRWLARWREGRRQPGRRFATQEEAEAFEREKQSTQVRARYERRDNVAFQLLAEWWLGQLMADGPHSLAESTIRRYATELRYAILPWAAKERWTAQGVTARDLQALVADREKAGHGARTKTVTVLRSLFRVAVEENWRGDNPAKDLRALSSRTPRRVARRTNGTPARLPSIPQIIEILDTIERPLVRLYAHTVMFTGARPSEAISLHWADIHMDEWLLFITPRIVESHGRRVLTEGKNAAASRQVELLEPMLDVLGELELYRRDDQPWLFPGRRTALAKASPWGSLPMSTDWANRQIVDALASAGIHESTYWLRHAFASLAIASGADELEIMEVMGHTDPMTVKRQYGQLFKRKPKERGAKMSAELARQRRAHGTLGQE